MGYIHRPYGAQSYQAIPYGFCPADLQKKRLFFAPLLRNLDFQGEGFPSFTRATTATYIDPVDGLVKTAAINEPRFETEGYLSEAQRTNSCIRSEELDNAIWNPTNITITANDATAPDGNVTAEKLTATAANGTLIQDLGVIPSAAKTFSFWAKRVTGTGNFDCTINGGGTWVTKVLTPSWQRFTVTATVADPDVGFRLVVSGDEVHVWGCQLEDSAPFASSYIPTVGAAVTRNTDLLTWPSVGNYLDAQGTIYVEAVLAADNETDYVLSVDNGGTSRYQLLYKDSGNSPIYFLNTSAGSSSMTTGADPYVAGVVKAVAGAWADNDFEMFTSGVSRNTDTTKPVPDGITTIRVGHLVGPVEPIFGYVRNVQIFSERLSAFDVARIR